MQMVDLKADVLAQQPRETFNSKTLGFFCWTAGKIECSIQLPRTGFVPDEVIPYVVHVNNASNFVEIQK